MSELFIIIPLYLLAAEVCKYTVASRYSWYQRINVELMMRYNPKYVTMLMNFKGFTCESCHFFWICLATLSLLGVENELIYSLILYLIKTNRNENNTHIQQDETRHD